MGLLGNIIAKGVMTAATNSTIRAVGDAAAHVIETNNKKTQIIETRDMSSGVMIKPTRSSDDYYRENALEIAQELLGAGFDSVTLKPANELGEWTRKRYGEIKSISINGNREFKGVRKMPASSYIVIQYLDFKKNVNMTVYENIEKITPGVMSRNEPKESLPKSNSNSANGQKKFCPYCGGALTVVDARFCTSCGNAID